MNAPVEPAAANNTPPPTGANSAPEISGNAPRVIKVGVAYSFTPQATDADGDPLTFSINNKPMWVTFDISNGNITGVPLLGHEGTYNDIEISVSDGLMSIMLPQFSISVEPNTTPNMPPEIDGTPATRVTVGDSYMFAPTGSDPDGDQLSYSIQNIPGWATFSPSTGKLSGTPQSGQEGTFSNIAISVSDSISTASTPPFSITVIAANPTETIVDNQDANTTQTGTWSTSGAANPYLGNSVYCDSGCTFTWQPNLPVSGTYEVYAYWTYKENRSSSVPYRTHHDGGTATVVVDQHDTTLGSQWNLLGIYNLTAGTNGTVTVSSENGQTSADAVRYVLINDGLSDTVPPTDPSGLSATTISGSQIDLAWAASTDDVYVSGYNVYQDGNYTTPVATVTAASYSVAGLTPSTLYTFEVTAFDPAGNESALSNTATAVTTATANSAPQISGTPSATVNVGQDYVFTPTANDPDGNNLLFSIQNMPRWAQFDSTTGTLSGTPQVGDAGTYTSISISVSDGNLSDTLPDFTITANQISMGSAILSWVPPTQNTDGSVLTDLAGFNIYYGTSPGSYPNQITINNPGITGYVVDNLTANTWYFVSTSFNSTGMESEFSNVTTKTIN